MIRMSDNPRILIVGVDWLGDVIFSTPLIRALRRRFPDAFIAYSTAGRSADVLKGNPYLDAVVRYDERLFFPGVAANWAFAAKLKSLRFDTALFLHRSATRAFFASLGGIRRRVGAATGKNRIFLTETFEPRPGGHRIDRYLRLLEPMNAPADGREVDYFVDDDDRAALRAVLRGLPIDGARRYAVIHPGGNWGLKRWPAEAFASVGAYLIGRGFNVAVCGAGNEVELADSIIARLDRTRAVSLAGKTSLRILGALIEKARVLVSNDSGPIHLAAGLGTPILGVFGPTAPEETGPVSRGPARIVSSRIGCRLPCYFEDCRHRVCLDGLGAGRVIEELEGLLA